MEAIELPDKPSCTPVLRSLVDHWVNCEPKSCTFCSPSRTVWPGFDVKGWHKTTTSDEERECLMELLSLAAHGEMLDPRSTYVGYLERDIYWSANSRKE